MEVYKDGLPVRWIEPEQMKIVLKSTGGGLQMPKGADLYQTWLILVLLRVHCGKLI